jgi:hypothetical protein
MYVQYILPGQKSCETAGQEGGQQQLGRLEELAALEQLKQLGEQL